jgi:hypothetical protein
MQYSEQQLEEFKKSGELEKFIGSTFYRLKYELQQDKKAFWTASSLIVVALGCLVFTYFVPNMIFFCLFVYWFFLFWLVSWALKKTSIESAPSSIEIFNYLKNINKLDLFIEELEQKITLSDVYFLLKPSLVDKGLFNLFFTGVFGLLIVILKFLYGSSDVEIALIAIITYLYTVLVLHIKESLSENSLYITLAALNFLKRQRDNG